MCLKMMPWVWETVRGETVRGMGALVVPWFGAPAGGEVGSERYVREPGRGAVASGTLPCPLTS